MSGLLLGVDLGTTSLKGLVTATDGGLRYESSLEIAPLEKSPMELEQDPDSWWDAFVGVCRALAEKVDLGAVEAVGLSGQTHGVVLVDAQGRPVRPCLTWADKRARAESEYLQGVIGDRVRSIASNELDPTFSLPKLAWLAGHEPMSLSATERLVLPKDYLRGKMTGQWATDVSDAASTLLFDLHRQEWDHDLAREIGIPTHIFPDVHQSTDVVGSIDSTTASATGLRQGTPVVAGGSDVACAALGAGLSDDGTVYLNVGTAAQILAFSPSPSGGGFYVFQHVVPDSFIRMTSVFAAGLSRSWVRDLLSSTEQTDRGADALEDEAQEVAPGAGGVRFLPYLLGRGLPRPDPSASGALFGLTPASGPAEVYRAVLEGVAFVVRIGVESLGPEPSRFMFGGGARRSRLWTEIIAAVLESDLDVLDYDASPVGCLTLAGLGTGVFETPDQAWALFADSRRRVGPQPGQVSRYRELYPGFAEVALS